MKLQDSTAIITGGASGLGAATARHFASLGANVVLLDRDTEHGAAVAADIGDKARFVAADVTSEADVQGAVELAAQTFGGLHITVNCAGVAWASRTVGREGPHALDLFEPVIRINLIGTFNVIRLAAAKMQGNEPNADGERGVIINTASVAAFDGQIGQAAYSASKGGVVGMTLPIARDLARMGVRVMTIAPGIFETPMVGLMTDELKQSMFAQIPFPARFGSPAEYARLAQAIVENPYLNGETIRLDAAVRLQPK
jgi:NAD(P)-dependent dehydrogenase (short-subunit alcohol dehydrogenase family)